MSSSLPTRKFCHSCERHQPLKMFHNQNPAFGLCSICKKDRMSNYFDSNFDESLWKKWRLTSAGSIHRLRSKLNSEDFHKIFAHKVVTAPIRNKKVRFQTDLTQGTGLGTAGSPEVQDSSTSSDSGNIDVAMEQHQQENPDITAKDDQHVPASSNLPTSVPTDLPTSVPTDTLMHTQSMDPQTRPVVPESTAMHTEHELPQSAVVLISHAESSSGGVTEQDLALSAIEADCNDASALNVQNTVCPISSQSPPDDSPIKPTTLNTTGLRRTDRMNAGVPAEALQTVLYLPRLAEVRIIGPSVFTSPVYLPQMDGDSFYRCLCLAIEGHHRPDTVAYIRAQVCDHARLIMRESRATHERLEKRQHIYDSPQLTAHAICEQRCSGEPPLSPLFLDVAADLFEIALVVTDELHMNLERHWLSYRSWIGRSESEFNQLTVQDKQNQISHFKHKILLFQHQPCEQGHFTYITEALDYSQRFHNYTKFNRD